MNGKQQGKRHKSILESKQGFCHESMQENWEDSRKKHMEKVSMS